MRLLTVPNWSFGRDKDLLRAFRGALESNRLHVYYCQGDIDHNRTVTAFSGEPEDLMGALLALCALAFDRIDLNKHTGVHPRIGALDVCPFVLLPGDLDPKSTVDAQQIVDTLGRKIAETWGVPVFLYEKSEKGRHEADLPSLRKGGFGSLLERELRPDCGPAEAHPLLGVTVMGLRDFLIAFNVNLATDDLKFAKDLAREIRDLRAQGDERFLGVRSLGFPLAGRGLMQVSLNLTLPDLTPVDPIIEWIRSRASAAETSVAETELVGVIRDRDLAGASRLAVRPEQIVEG